MNGHVLFTSVHLTREAAEQEAHELRRTALAEDWTDRLEHSYDGLR